MLKDEYWKGIYCKWVSVPWESHEPRSNKTTRAVSHFIPIYLLIYPTTDSKYKYLLNVYFGIFACNILIDVVSAAVSKDGPPKNQTSWYCYLRGTLPNWVETSLLLALPKRMWQGVPVLGLALKRTAGFSFFHLGTFGSPKLLSNKSGYCAG